MQWTKIKEGLLTVAVFVVVWLLAWPIITYLVAFELAPIFWNTHTSSGVDFAVGLWILSIISLCFNITTVWSVLRGYIEKRTR